MDTKPLVSVIIPTYKNDGSLEKSIDSVLHQSYDNIEIIVVDDNEPSSEHRRFTEEIMKRYENNERVIYVKHAHNKNGSAARNTGFNHSKGIYISLLDDDDTFVKDKTALQVEFLNQHTEFDAVYGGRYEKSGIILYEKSGDLTEDLLSYSILPCTCSLMLRREVYASLNGFNETYRRHQDFEFLLRFFEKSRIGVINKPLFYRKSNAADNRLNGKELEKQKLVFLREFDTTLRRIDNEKNGFKRSIYSLHFARVFWNYVKNFKLLSALKILLKYTVICREKLYVEMFKYARAYFRI